ncbi:cadmium resistance transporter [Krasilnikovia sp. M28-CT-15]|uniref:cadmium resistance transporter n=1 Tax=Krasilnikovia sp. M28-CT-15 TaxID=3373540 RepID=UPI00399C9244
MSGLPATTATAVGVFAGTNVDDLVVLTVLFLAARAAGRPAPWRIWAGQYLGIGVLVCVSVLAALGLALVPDRHVGWLGLVPIALGVRGLVGAIRDGADSGGPPVAAAGVLSVAGVTIANGADNIAVYTPVFRTLGAADSALVVAVFAALVAVWCAAAAWLGGHRRVVALVGRYGHWLVPLVFIAIGGVILAQSGVVGRLF